MTQSISGAVETRPPDELDSDRYEWLTLDQAEPNPGLPDSDGAVFVSNADGTRSWTTTPTFSGLNFKTGTLDEIPQIAPIYYLALKGDPRDDLNDSIGWTFGVFEEQDTLQTVTDRGNTTTNDITIANLFADSASITGGATVGGDVFILGDLIVNGDQTIINSTTLTVDDKNIVIAQGAINALAADGAGITVDGANATITYNASTDRWELNKDLLGLNAYLTNNLIFDGGADQDITNLTGALNIKSSSTVISDVAGSNVLASFTSGNIVLDEILNVSDSAIMEGKLFLQDVPEKAGTTRVLHRRTSDGLVMEGEVDFALQSDVDKIRTEDTDSNATHYLVFTYANAGAGGIDSAYIDTSDLTYNPSSNTLSLENIIATGLSELDSTNVEGDIRIKTSSSVSGSGRLLDSDGRSFVVYDSAGRLLWGNNGTSVGDAGIGPVYVVELDNLSDVVLTAPSAGQVLKYDGTNWINDTDNEGSGGGAPVSGTLATRTTPSVATSIIGNNAQVNVNITDGFPTYALLKIQTSHAAWVRLYSDTTSRTNDESRLITDDPTPDAGVIAEVITTGAQTIKMSPGVIGWNENADTTIPIRVQNLSGGNANITVTLTAVELEA